MSKAIDWIGKNLSLGGLVRHAGSGVGAVGKLTAQGVGATASAVTNDPATKQKIRAACSKVGSSFDFGLSKGSAVMGDVINIGVQKASSAVGYASGGAAKLMGASEDHVTLATKIGTVAGAVIVGVVVGSGIADAAVAVAAASGTAGAAATTSGLAALGGGSIAAGGGGMAAGQAITQGIVAASAASGAAALKKDGDV